MAHGTLNVMDIGQGRGSASNDLVLAKAHSHEREHEAMVLKTESGREPEKGVVPVPLVRPGSDRWSNR